MKKLLKLLFSKKTGQYSQTQLNSARYKYGETNMDGIAKAHIDACIADSFIFGFGLKWLESQTVLYKGKEYSLHVEIRCGYWIEIYMTEISSSFFKDKLVFDFVEFLNAWNCGNLEILK